MGQPSYALPAAFESMSVPSQLLVLVNSDRALYGLTQVTGLNSALNAAAQAAIAKDADPSGLSSVEGVRFTAWASNWAAGWASALYTYYEWMYDDGVGSSNADCSAQYPSGCWGHRTGTLRDFGTAVVMMGVGMGTSPKYNAPAFTEIFEGLQSMVSVSTPAASSAQGPIATSPGVGFIDTVVQGTDGQLWQSSYGTGGWKWTALGVSASSGAGAVASGSGRVDVFSRGSAGQLIHAVCTNGVCAAPQNVGGVLAGQPAAVSPNPGELDVFVRGTDGRLWEASSTSASSTWTWSQPQGAIIQGDPSASTWGSGRIDLFAAGAGGALMHMYTTGSSWTSLESLGGSLVGRPAAASWSSGRVDVFVVGADGTLWQDYWAVGATSWRWVPFALPLGSSPAVTAWGSGRLDVFARGPRGDLTHFWYNGVWNAPESLGGVIS